MPLRPLFSRPFHTSVSMSGGQRWRNAWACLAVALSLNAGMAAAQTAPATAKEMQQAAAKKAVQAERDAQLARIVAERAAIQQRRSQQEALCYQRFAVEDCLREVRTQARTEDNALRKQEQEIQAIERQEKTAERLRTIEEKIEEKNRQMPALAPVDGKIRAPRQAPLPKASPADGPTPQDLVDVQAQRAQQARERAQDLSERQKAHAAEQSRKQAGEDARRSAARARYEQKQRQAQQHRQRAAAAQDQKAKAAPLPSPAAP